MECKNCNTKTSNLNKLGDDPLFYCWNCLASKYPISVPIFDKKGNFIKWKPI